MKLLSWNCRGSGGTTIATLNRYLHCTGAEIVFLSETRCGGSVADRRVREANLCNYEIVDSAGRSGGLWLLWSNNYNIRVSKKKKHLIIAEVQERSGGPEWLLVAVYGDPARSQNRSIWAEIE